MSMLLAFSSEASVYVWWYWLSLYLGGLLQFYWIFRGGIILVGHPWMFILCGREVADLWINRMLSDILGKRSSVYLVIVSTLYSSVWLVGFLWYEFAMS
jgi:hypothetical protein